MKKILVLMIFIMTSLTMYFLVWWEPTKENSKSTNTSTVVENKGDTKKNEKLEDTKKQEEENEKETIKEENKEEREENKKNEENLKKQEEERIKKLEEEKENNKLIAKNINENMTTEDKKSIDKLLSGLSTVDLMKIEEGILIGDLSKVKKIINERLLEEDSKLFFEIVSKYKYGK